MDKQYGPIAALVLGGLLLVGAGQFSPTEKLPEANMAGQTLLCIAEKTNPPINHSLAIRDAKSFCESHGFKGYLYLDDDDALIQPIVAAAAARNIQSPLLISTKIDSGKITKLDRIRPWQNGLEDILK